MSFLKSACMLCIYSVACVCGENYEVIHKLVTVVAPGEGAQRLAGKLIFHYRSF